MVVLSTSLVFLATENDTIIIKKVMDDTNVIIKLTKKIIVPNPPSPPNWTEALEMSYHI